VVAGYSVTDHSAQVSQLTNVNDAEISFYWTVPGQDMAVTYSYVLSDQSNNAATAIFSAAGPTGVSVTAQIGTAAVVPIVGNMISEGGTPKLKLLGIHTSGGLAGIAFQVTGTPPAGNTGHYTWVQLINNDQLNAQNGNVREACFCDPSVPGACPLPSPDSPQLDTVYPYSVVGTSQGALIPGDMATDGPDFTLRSDGVEVSRQFSATMYTMWVPDPMNGCAAQNCVIPIPLGYVGTGGWSFEGDGIDTLTNQDSGYSGTHTFWILGYAPQGNLPTFTSSSSYPTWQAIYGPGNQLCPIPQ
jgi:hypothetical protein